MRIMLLYGLILISFLGSCCSGRTTNEVFIRDTTYIVKPKEVRFSDTITKIDSSYMEYLRKNHNDTDTLIYIKFYPEKRKLEGVFKPDTVRVAVRDTLYNTKIEEKIIETPMLSKIGLVLAGIAMALVGIAVFRERNK
jgi:hypothetical protein